MQRLILLLFFTNLVFNSYSQNFWTYDTLSTDGRYHTVATVGNKIYLFNGWQTRGNYYGNDLKHMEIINTITGEHNLLPIADSILERKPSPSFPFNHYKVLQFEHYLLYPMGYRQGTNTDIFNTKTQTWSTLDIPFSRYGIAMAANDSLLIFWGGGDYTNIYRYVNYFNRKDSTWETIETTLRPNGNDTYVYGGFYSSTAFIENNKMFFVGGKGSMGYIFNHYREYDFGSKKWNLDQYENNWNPDPFPYQAQPRYNSTVERYKNNVYICGGEIENTVATSTIEVYNTSTETWSHIDIPNANLDMPVTFSAITGSKLFLLAKGGLYSPDSDSVIVYDLERSTWESFGLPHSRLNTSMAAANGKVYFMGGQQVNTTGGTTSNDVDYTTFNHIDIYNLTPQLQALNDNADTLSLLQDTLNPSEQEQQITLHLHNTGDYHFFFAQNETSLANNSKIQLQAHALPDSLNPAQETNITLLVDANEEGIINDTLIAYTDIEGKEVFKLPIEIHIKKEEPNAVEDFTATEENICIYPNPASNTLSITVPLNYSKGGYNLLSIDGRLIKSGTLSGSETQVNTTEVSNGTYILKTETDGNVTVSKVLIQK